MTVRKAVRYAAALTLAAMSLSAVADSRNGGCEDRPMSGIEPQRPMVGMGVHHGEMMGLHRLNLSDEQHDKVFELLQSQMRQQHEAMRAGRKAHEELRKLSQEPVFDVTKAKAAADQISQLMSQQMLLRAKTESQVRALLRPEQRKVLDESSGQRQPGPRMAPGRHHD